MDENKTRSFVFYLSLALVGSVALAGLLVPQPFYVVTKAFEVDNNTSIIILLINNYMLLYSNICDIIYS